MPNPRSRFFWMQRCRHYSMYVRRYLKLMDARAGAGDMVSANSHAEIAYHAAIEAARAARRWKHLVEDHLD